VRAPWSRWGLGLRLRRLLGVRLGLLYQHRPRPLAVPEGADAARGNDLPAMVLVTPSFNQARYIGATISSVLSQDYPHLQYIVQDGASTDGTAAVLRGFRESPVEIRVRPDRGQTHALNLGFFGTTAPVMGYLNSDDMLCPGALDIVGRIFRDEPDTDVIYGNRLIVDADGAQVGRWILPGHDPDLLRFIDYVPQETLFWRRQIWERTGARFNEDLQFAMDWELLLRFLDAGARFRHVPELFGIFRAHASQKSQSDFAVRGIAEMAQLRARFLAPQWGIARRALVHARYLYRHRHADAQYARLIGSGGALHPDRARNGLLH